MKAVTAHSEAGDDFIKEDTSEFPLDRFLLDHPVRQIKTRLFRAEVFVNLQRFSLDVSQAVSQRADGPLMMLLCFYSRIYERLLQTQTLNDHKKARNAVGSFFAPLPDPEAELIGLREILAFTRDFDVFVSKNKIHKIWLTVVGEGRWGGKIGLSKFLEILCVIGEVCFEDAAWESPGERVRRFIRHYELGDAKKLKSKLFDVYRDKYMYMYSEYENFDSILKTIDVLALPNGKVVPLKGDPLGLKSNEGMKYLRGLVTMKEKEIWEKYEEVGILDLGVLKKDAQHEYKIDIYNICHFLLTVDVAVESVSGLDPLEIRWNGYKRLSSGCMLTLCIKVDTELTTDWFGKLKIRVNSAAGETEELAIPCVCRVSEEVSRSMLPSIGISPFSSRIPSAQIVRLDPSRTDNLRSRRPGSALTSRPLSAVPPVIAGPTLGERPKRPLSSVGPRTTAMSRPDSAVRRPLTANNKLSQ